MFESVLVTSPAQATSCSRAKRFVHRREILGDHRLALCEPYVLRIDSLMCRSPLARQHAGDGEEAGLQHGVGARPEPDLLGDLAGVDDEKAQLLVDDLLLHRARQMVPDLVGADAALEQEGGAGRGEAQHVVPLEEVELVARRRNSPS